MGLTQKAKGKLIGRVMTEAMPNGATPTAYSGTVTSKPAANGLRTVLNFQRVGSQRYFDAAGFPGRTLGLEANGGKQKPAGKYPRRMCPTIRSAIALCGCRTSRDLRRASSEAGIGRLPHSGDWHAA